MRRGNVIGTCVSVLGELHYGAENSTSRERALRELRAAQPSLRVWPYTNEAAEEYGRIAAELRRTGRPMQQIDIQIAAIAFSLGNCTVVTTDSELSAVPGLRVESWAAPAPLAAAKLATPRRSRHNPGVEPDPNTQPRLRRGHSRPDPARGTRRRAAQAARPPQLPLLR
ncbi:type II toxin-antitoxin system VapC family toxin [Gemmata sp. JC673]|uniref:Type II toxin-antitoxin system VapC family toxin n=1 Tax=Gemmata algarum TaxID=2975278 RepID=A0ABU5F858_9BACT|nr:type II toxin-antitoxin system VapC family toxin [Gemmata algarum]